MRNTEVYYINILWQEQEAEGLLANYVDPKPGRQLEDVEEDWDTKRKQILDYQKHPGTL